MNERQGDRKRSKDLEYDARTRVREGIASLSHVSRECAAPEPRVSLFRVSVSVLVNFVARAGHPVYGFIYVI